MPKSVAAMSATVSIRTSDTASLAPNMLSLHVQVLANTMFSFTASQSVDR